MIRLATKLLDNQLVQISLNISTKQRNMNYILSIQLLTSAATKQITNELMMKNLKKSKKSTSDRVFIKV